MKYNRVCAWCGDKYYACKTCISIHSIKNVCCSVSCFRELIESGRDYAPKEYDSGVNGMIVLLRAGLKNGKTIDITGYDLELGKFDCSDNITRGFGHFDYFIVPISEMEDLSRELYKVRERDKTPSPDIVNENNIGAKDVSQDEQIVVDKPTRTRTNSGTKKKIK